MSDGNGNQFGRSGHAQLAQQGLSPEALPADEMPSTASGVQVSGAASSRRPRIVKVRESSVTPAEATTAPPPGPRSVPPASVPKVAAAERVTAPLPEPASSSGLAPSARVRAPLLAPSSAPPPVAEVLTAPLALPESLGGTGKMFELDDTLRAVLRAAMLGGEKSGKATSPDESDGDVVTQVFDPDRDVATAVFEPSGDAATAVFSPPTPTPTPAPRPAPRRVPSPILTYMPTSISVVTPMPTPVPTNLPTQAPAPGPLASRWISRIVFVGSVLLSEIIIAHGADAMEWLSRAGR